MEAVIELAKSGRSRCRACEQPIAVGTLRIGERVDNPYGDGVATHWFHPRCAAHKRPECFVRVQFPADLPLPDLREPELQELLELAREGVEHPRLSRIRSVEHARSARAMCRSCRTTIAARGLRLVLDIWEEGHFKPIGFIHLRCAGEYFGTTQIVARIKHAVPDLAHEDLQQIEAALQAGPERNTWEPDGGAIPLTTPPSRSAMPAPKA